MAVVFRMLLLVTVAAILAQLTSAQQSRPEVTITEPGVYQLADLFKSADTVALVKIVSGDTETYSRAVYKAEVVKELQGRCNGRGSLLRSVCRNQTRIGVYRVPAQGLQAYRPEDVGRRIWNNPILGSIQ